MKVFLSLRLALRFLFSHRSGSFSSYASWLAIGGLSIGVTALMLTASIIQGFQQIISEKLSSFEGQARISHIIGKPINNAQKPINFLLKRPDILIEPFIRGVSMVRYSNYAEGVLIEGVNILPKSISNNDNDQVEKGNIILGNSLAKSLNINIGDTLFLQSFSKAESPFHIPRIKSLIVGDIFYSGLQEYDKTLAYVNLHDARWLFDLQKDHVSGFILNSQVTPEIVDNINYPFHIETWKERHDLLFEWISLQRWPAYLMFGLIALVGLVNLIASLAMIIIEKSSQIGILIAQGIKRSQLMQIFLFQGVFIGLMGGLLGGFLSTIIIFLQLNYGVLKIPSDIYFMDQVPFSFDIFVFTSILSLVFIFSVIASWIPVSSLARIKPAVALRYE